MIDVVMLEDCTEIVITRPNNIATVPAPLPRTLLREASIRSATSFRIFFVINAREIKMMTSPIATNKVPSTLPDAPIASPRSFSQPTGSFTHFLIGLFHSLPAEPTSCSLIFSAEFDKTLVANSIGKTMDTAIKLKKS